MTFEYAVIAVRRNQVGDALTREAAHGWRLVHIFEPPYVPYMGEETHDVILERPSESNQEGT